MNATGDAITALYGLKGDAFDHRFAIMTTNAKRQLLEDFVRAPAIHGDVEELLGDLSAALIQTQKTACGRANITEDQGCDFADRLDGSHADAVIAIRNSYAMFPDRSSIEFQLEAARRLGLQIAS
jgi:hypothetical protein